MFNESISNIGAYGNVVVEDKTLINAELSFLDDNQSNISHDMSLNIRNRKLSNISRINKIPKTQGAYSSIEEEAYNKINQKTPQYFYEDQIIFEENENEKEDNLIVNEVKNIFLEKAKKINNDYLTVSTNAKKNNYYLNDKYNIPKNVNDEFLNSSNLMKIISANKSGHFPPKIFSGNNNILNNQINESIPEFNSDNFSSYFNCINPLINPNIISYNKSTISHSNVKNNTKNQNLSGLNKEFKKKVNENEIPKLRDYSNNYSEDNKISENDEDKNNKIQKKPRNLFNDNNFRKYFDFSKSVNYEKNNENDFNKLNRKSSNNKLMDKKKHFHRNEFKEKLNKLNEDSLKNCFVKFYKDTMINNNLNEDLFYDFRLRLIYLKKFPNFIKTKNSSYLFSVVNNEVSNIHGKISIIINDNMRMNLYFVRLIIDKEKDYLHKNIFVPEKILKRKINKKEIETELIEENKIDNILKEN